MDQRNFTGLKGGRGGCAVSYADLFNAAEVEIAPEERIGADHDARRPATRGERPAHECGEHLRAAQCWREIELDDRRMRRDHAGTPSSIAAAITASSDIACMQSGSGHCAGVLAQRR